MFITGKCVGLGIYQLKVGPMYFVAHSYLLPTPVDWHELSTPVEYPPLLIATSEGETTHRSYGAGIISIPRWLAVAAN